MRQILLLSIFLNIFSLSQAQTVGTVSGEVRDNSGALIPGVNIRIKEVPNLGTSTSMDGQYRLTNVSTGSYTLEASFIGFSSETKSFIINSNDQITINFILSENDVLLEGATVTAQRREEDIQKVPISVTSYDKKFISEFNIREIDALSEFVPGLQVQLQSPNNPGFVIRGITSDNGDSRIEPRVSVFQDGVSISKSRGSVIEVFDMERVEVLKGPQGTLFGRGAQIGAVHFVQNKAQRDLAGELTLGYGNYNQQLASGFVNTPISDKLFFRLAGQYNKRDGFIENISGGNLNGKETGAFRASLRWLPTQKTIVDLIYNYQKDNYPGTAFISGTVAPIGREPNPFATTNLESGEDLGIKRNVWGTTLLVDQLLTNNFTLNSITAFRQFDSDEAFDADGSELPVLSFSEIAFGRQFSQELRFTYDNKRNFTGFFGGSYFHENGYQRVPFVTNENSFVALVSPVLNAATGGAFPILPTFNPDGTPFLAAGALLGIPFKERHTESNQNYGQVNAYEAFADGTYTLNKLAITLGLRATHERVNNGYEAFYDGSPSVVSLALGNPFGAAPNLIFRPTDGRVRGKGSFTSLVGRGVLAYTINDNLNTYANISRGRRPNVIQVNPDGVEELNAEIVWSYELGLKGLYKKFSYDLAAYFYDYSNFQVTVVDNQAGTIQAFTRDAGNANAVGFETSFRYAFNRNLSIFGNYSFIDAKFNDTDKDGNQQELAGNRFRLTPKHSFSLGIFGDFPLTKGGIFIRPSYTYKSLVFFEEENQEGISQDGYGLLNMRTGYYTQNRKWELAIYGSNSLNEEYLVDAGNTGLLFGTPTFIAGPPTLFGFQITGRF